MTHDHAPPGLLAAIRLGHMGDVALTTGVLEHWRQTRGHACVVITRRAFAPLFEGHPAVVRVEALDPGDLSGLGNWMRTARRLARVCRGATLVDLHGVLRTRLLALAWEGAVRRFPKFGLERRLFLGLRLDWARRRLAALNVPQRYALALDQAAPRPEAVRPRVFLSDQERAWAAGRLAELGITGQRPLALLHPYATHPNKAWPADRWPELAGLLDRAGWDTAAVGSAAEEAQRPLARLGPRDLTGATDLRQTCALLARADALVTGDSGPMHLGTASGAPVTALFGPTRAEWGFAPSGPRDSVLETDLPCRPCSLHGRRPCPRDLACLAAIEPGRVLAEVLGKGRRAEAGS